MKYLKLFIFASIILSYSHSIADECKIIYGVYFDYKPYEWVENGIFRGINIDLMNAVAKKSKCTVKYVTYPWFDLVEKLKNKEIDVISSSINAETLMYGLPLPTNFVQYRIIWGTQNTQKIDDIHSLENQTVLLAEDNIANAMLKNENIKAKLIYKKTEDEILQALKNNEANYAIIDNSAYYLLERYPELKIVSEPMFPTLYGFILNPENQKYPILNKALDDLKKTGEYYQIINHFERKQYYHILRIAIGIGLLAFSIFIIVMVWNKSLHGQVTKKTKSLNNEINKHIATEAMLRIKTEENNNNIKLLQTILNTIPETIYVSDKDLNILWKSNTKSNYYDIKLIKEDAISALYKLNQSTEFTVKDSDNNIWKIFIIKFHYTSETNFLIVARDITETILLQDELFMTTRYSALGEMSAIIAHEINTPLGSVIHNIDFLSEYINCKNQKTLKDIEAAKNIINKSLIKIKNIVDELKKYTNNQRKEYENIDLAECCRNATGITRFLINKSTSNFEMQIHSEPLLINGNSEQIEQTIINILQNACYALTEKSQKIKLSLTTEDNKIIISVSDEGNGMDDSTLKKATLPYFTTRKSKGGTGLGLSLTSRLIKEHKGQLEIISKENVGTTVRIIFNKGV